MQTTIGVNNMSSVVMGRSMTQMRISEQNKKGKISTPYEHFTFDHNVRCTFRAR